MRIARVFPRRTKATPIDDLTFCNEPELWPPEVDEVHVSVTFTWDLPRAEYLARAWKSVAPVKIGGPATGMLGGEFIPGRYLKPGYVITSRGCPNRCWFCSVWKREGQKVRTLPIHDGWNVLDDNLLACHPEHILDVFAMLKRQPERAQFTGGLEAARLRDWHIDLLLDLKPKQMFFAYDEPDDWEPLVGASKKLLKAGFTTASHALRCYVLIGYPGDTPEAAEKRLTETLKIGFTPMAMFYRDQKNIIPREWHKFRKFWSRPASIHGRIK